MRFPHSRVFPAQFIRGMTITELIISLFFIFLLMMLALPALPGFGSSGCGSIALTQQLSNMRQLHVATQQMALDAFDSKDPNTFDWTCRPDGTPATLSEWKAEMVRRGYLSAADIEKLFSRSVARRLWWPRIYPDVISLYALRYEDPGATVFASTSNWHGFSTPTSTEPPFERGAFAIFRKGGDGQVLQAKLYSNPETIGTGGKYNYLRLEP